MSYDISFCSNAECERKDCRRHLDNAPKEGLYSMAEFNKENTYECDWYWEKSEVKK